MTQHVLLSRCPMESREKTRRESALKCFLGVFKVRGQDRGVIAMSLLHAKRSPLSGAQPIIQLGLRANWQQFSLLVLINAFVGGMVGLERTILPLLAEHDFGIASKTAIL